MKLVGRHDLKSQFGIDYSREHIRRLIKARKFPTPVRLSDTPGGPWKWDEAEILNYLSDAKARRDRESENVEAPAL